LAMDEAGNEEDAGANDDADGGEGQIGGAEHPNELRRAAPGAARGEAMVTSPT
jgi:hypothetical protein